MESIIHCPSCGSADLMHVLNVEDHTVSHEKFEIIECRYGCGFSIQVVAADCIYNITIATSSCTFDVIAANPSCDLCLS